MRTSWLSILPAAMVVACARKPPVRDLPPGVHLVTPRAGRYAMLLESEQRGGCSQSHFYSTSRASLVLTLDEEGGASGCRGRKWTSTVASNDFDEDGMPAPDAHPDVTELMEQQGMRGTWRLSSGGGDVLRIDLALDDSICPPKRNAASLEARPWSLECVALEPPTSKPPKPAPTETEPAFPALACHLVDFEREPGLGAYPHDVGYTVAEPFELFGRDTLFLAPDPGVAIEEHAFGGLNPEGMRTWKRPSQPIAFDAWSSQP